MITPHRRPSTVIGTPTADPMPAALDHRETAPEAWEYASILTGPPLEKTIDITFWPPSRTSVPSGTARPSLRQPTIAVTEGPSPYRPIRTRSAESNCPASWATAASTVDGGSPCATSVATRRKRGLFVGDPAEVGVHLRVVQRDGELAGDQLDRVRALGGERAADQPVLQQQHRPQAAAAEDRHGQQRAAVERRRSRGRGRSGRRRWRRRRPAAHRCAGRSAAPTAASRARGRRG